MKKQTFWQKVFGVKPTQEVGDRWVGKEEPPLREASTAKREQTRRAAQALRSQRQAETGFEPTSLLLAQQFANESTPSAEGSKHETHSAPSHSPSHSDHNSWGGGHHSGGHDFGGGGHSGGFDGGGFSGGDGGGGSF